MSKRTFGVEIECGHPRFDCDNVCDRMRAEGFRVRWGSASPDTYGIGSDGSGIEVRTPVLSGARGFKELTRIMDYLFDLGCYVTKSDGMHVHVGAAAFKEDVEAARILARTWYNNQALISRMCSQHRLKAHYSRPWKEHYIPRLGNVVYPGKTYQHQAWGPKTRGLSFSKLNYGETVEFRMHEGCLDASKAVAWVQFCQALVDHAATERKVLTCARSKTALLDAVGVPETVRAKLYPRQPQMPRSRSKPVRKRAKS